jgi:uncharacterized membrane protein (UPF0127 family)
VRLTKEHPIDTPASGAGKGRFRVTNATRHTVLAQRCRTVTGMVSRGVGLIGRKTLPPEGGLIIRPCNSVVSFFMRFPIDVIFVSGEDNVLYVLERMRPWRTSKIVRGSKYVIELPAGTAKATETAVGDHIEIEPY